jgi:indolepyruvate ferredoxin oxidoreductase beta subunit
MTERTAVADGRVDADAIIQACRSAAMDFVGFDMQRIAEDNRSVISAVLLGAVAGSNALPFVRADYEDAIRAGGKGTKPSLAAFAAGYAAAQSGASAQAVQAAEPEETAPPIVAVSDDITGEARRIVLAGIDRTADYQDRRYAQDYYDRLQPFIAWAKSAREAGQSLLGETARQLALGMTYEDTVRVAELKIRASRFQRVQEEIGATTGQIVDIVEFMHPRIEEIADTLPAPIGRWLLRNPPARSIVERLTSRGRMVRTTSLSGFLLLYALASMKGIRRSTLRFAREQQFLAEWLETVRQAASRDMSIAIGFAQLRNLVKGYGDTHQRGLMKYHAIRTVMLDRPDDGNAARTLARLLAAAEKDEEGTALHAEIRSLATSSHTAIAG